MGQGVPGGCVTGYDQEVFTHNESALHVLFVRADLKRGFRAIAGL
jgi:molybdate-binding protein